MALPLFAGTLFVSAFFLFLVQPIIGKMILPKLGGTPQVWNTCMVFFQTALVAGYAYTHTVSTRLPLRKQLLVHGLFLLLPFIVLLPPLGPFNFNSEFNQGFLTSSLGGNPIPNTLALLAIVVGLPFLVVATSAPLLQKWFASTGHPAAKDPYFLYGASNLGSLLALLLYPVLVEPWFLLSQQAWIFAGGYTLLVMLVLACAGLVWAPSGRLLPLSGGPAPEPASGAPASTSFSANDPAKTGMKKGPPRPMGKPGSKGAWETSSIERGSEEVTTWRRLRWIGLAAVPTSFMLGVTTHITTDLSPIPLFWLVPLTLYLLSFILVYSRWPVLWVDQPHKITLFVQPIAIAAMIFCEIITSSFRDASQASTLFWTVFFNLAAFFSTALVCHGELAKDRPNTKHLTEYYLLMSVGGMLGGMFNGLLAPVLFIRVIEFNIALFLACMLRPTMKEEGWTDTFLVNMLEPPQQHHGGRPHPKGHKPSAALAHAQSTEGPPSYAVLLDFFLPLGVLVLLIFLVFVMTSMVHSLASTMAAGKGPDAVAGTRVFLAYGIPLIIACFYLGRPIRFGLAIGAVILIFSIYQSRGDLSIYSDRSYFGIIRVKQSDQTIKGISQTYNQLIHGHINHGMNFQIPSKEEDRGDPDKDFSRLATTYYHRYGPAGVVMEKFNWFSNGPYAFSMPQNTYKADARMPTSLVGLMMDGLGTSNLPTGAFVGLWSEPAFATIGLGTGTMASYARPYQHCHYYEIDNHIKRLSLPGDNGITYFNYLQQARKRGAEVQVLMGDARLRMALPYVNHYDESKKGPTMGGGPDNFYHMMVVDAFSSDAIPVHLITKEALELYFKKLTQEGVLCVHTSNRFVDLPKVVAAVADNLNLSYQRGHDNAPNKDEVGHFTSEWVMVARKPEYMKHLKTPPTNRQAEAYWTTPTADRRYIWTDDYSNLISVLR